MDDLPDELRERLSRLNADLVLDLLRPGEAVWLACDLIVAGVETPALLELAGESPSRLTLADGAPLVRQVLVELGVKPVDRSRAPGSSPAIRPPDDHRDELGLMLQPLEAWDETLPAHRDDEAIRAEMRELARGVVRAADARLTAGGMIRP